MAPSRESFPSAIARQTKRVAGRTDTALTPLSIRTSGVAADPELRAYIRERAGRKLGKFARHAERVTVRLTDVNAARGGVDTDCTIKIVVSGAPSIVVTDRAKTAREAFDLAVDGAERALRKAVRARQTAKRKPPAARAKSR